MCSTAVPARDLSVGVARPIALVGLGNILRFAPYTHKSGALQLAVWLLYTASEYCTPSLSSSKRCGNGAMSLAHMNATRPAMIPWSSASHFR